ncbi:MAG: UbiD family decarboxylase, partial [Burkholderia sp.]|nr:UbiD family decarboxylase [Burkholderia sp.]
MNSRESSPMTSLGAPANDVGPARTLRHWLAHLSRSGRVAAIDKPVALEHE